MIIVSGCLAGLNCAYDGKSRKCVKVVELVKKGMAIPVCPEQLGGLSTPRVPAERIGNRVIDKELVDVTEQFHKGAIEVLNLIKLTGCKKVILKSKSPSCGCGEIYDGTFTGKLVKGNGVLVDLLLVNGIKVETEDAHL